MKLKKRRTQCARRREKEDTVPGPVSTSHTSSTKVRDRGRERSGPGHRGSCTRNGLSTGAARQTNVLGVIKRQSWTDAFAGGNREKPRSAYAQGPPPPPRAPSQHQYAGRTFTNREPPRPRLRPFPRSRPSPETRLCKYPPSAGPLAGPFAHCMRPYTGYLNKRQIYRVISFLFFFLFFFVRRSGRRTPENFTINSISVPVHRRSFSMSVFKRPPDVFPSRDPLRRGKSDFNVTTVPTCLVTDSTRPYVAVTYA